MTDEDVTIIVRSVGERTEQKCVECLQKQFHTEKIYLIKNVTPFTEAVRRTMEIGIAENRKWTLVIDADVFLFENKIDSMFEVADKIMEKDSRVFCVLSALYDHFMEQSRLCGIHLYNTASMEKGKAFIENNMLRPETFLIRNMSLIGFSTYKLDMTIGIHDFFQSYSGIVSKGILHCKKHSNAEQLRSEWKQKCDDADFYWLCRAAEIADTIKQEDMKVDAKFIGDVVAKHIKEFPKQPLLTDNEIDEVLNKYKNEIAYEKMNYLPFPKEGKWKRLKRKIKGLVLSGK